MLARCAGGDKTVAARSSVLFEKQEEWAFVQGNPVPKLFEIAKQAGFTQESFDKCLTDQKLLDKITAGRDARLRRSSASTATPTFFINGKRLSGAPTLEKFDKVIEPLLKARAEATRARMTAVTQVALLLLVAALARLRQASGLIGRRRC